MSRILPTGIDILDRKLDGGIPRGRVVVLSASPVSQSELFLYEMATPRQTVYLTTERTEPDIVDSLEETGASTNDIDVHHVESSAPLPEATEVVANLSQESTLIVDPMRRLEKAETDAHRSFLNEIKTRTAETGSLTLLHCLEGRGVPVQRDRTEYLADIVFHLSTDFRGGQVENTLSIPKFRGGTSLPEVVDLDLTADVTIDVSRKIA